MKKMINTLILSVSYLISLGQHFTVEQDFLSKEDSLYVHEIDSIIHSRQENYRNYVLEEVEDSVSFSSIGYFDSTILVQIYYNTGMPSNTTFFLQNDSLILADFYFSEPAIRSMSMPPPSKSIRYYFKNDQLITQTITYYMGGPSPLSFGHTKKSTDSKSILENFYNAKKLFTPSASPFKGR